jgi:hypothetical protein
VKITIKGADALCAALQTLDARVENAAKKACEEEARRLLNDSKRHLPYLSMMYHATKREF